MRIVIDLQGAQTPSSRFRGIGRYSLALAQALVRNRGEHDVVITLNGLFPDSIEALRAIFEGLMPKENIVVWEAPGPVAMINPSNNTRRRIAESIREVFLESLKPDMVLVTSLFEGFDSDAITSIGCYTKIPTAVVLYDLIPLIYRGIYLNNPQLECWYLEKIDHLKRANLLLSISSSSGQEAVQWLDFGKEQVVNISSACDSKFVPKIVTDTERIHLKNVYSVQRPYILYVGGLDHRKNIENLLRAYAFLPKDLRQKYILVIVCTIQPSEKEQIEQFAYAVGLNKGEFVFTGFVPDDDLLILYNACESVVFPSWHEGFGLPVLEAMQCGKAVIAANSSSLPEIVGRNDALFNPFDPYDIAKKLEQVISDENFRHSLEAHALEQAKKFGWDITAQRALNAMADWNATQSTRRVISLRRRPSLAYLSPLPPERSGISEYSAELLQELTRWYKIEVIVNQIEVADPWVRANIPIRDVEWFRAHWHCYDRALYHFGNSTFHEYMFDLLEQIPGVIVLHDFFLSGIYAYRENVGGVSNVWSKALYLSHGYASLVERYAAKNIEDVILAYPCNLPVLQAALGIIVHSEHSRALARHWYGSYMDDKWIVIPPLYKPTLGFERHSSREKLRINEEDFVIASFGMLAPTKLNHRLLNAFLRSPLAHEPRAYLIFVGENHSGEYGQSLNEMIRGSGLERRIRITGWVEPEIYQSYLAAVDVAVQLRSASRGEYSRAALDCMSHGLATVVNAHGSMAELDSEGVWKLPDNFTDEQLIEALTILWQDGEKRQNLGKKAQEITLEKHSPRFCASRYADAIEHFYNLAHAGLQGLKEELMSNNLLNDNLSTEDLTQLATCLARNFPPLPRRRQLLVDVSGIAQNDLKNPKNDIERATISILRQWLLNPPENWSIKPIYFTLGMTGYRYAQRFTSRILNINEDWAEDEPAEAWQSDVFISFNLSHLVPTQESVLKSWRNRGVSIWFVVYDFPGLAHRNWLETICHFNGAVCISEAVADELRDWLKAHMPSREGLFRIEWFPLGENSEVWLKQILTVFPSS